MNSNLAASLREESFLAILKKLGEHHGIKIGGFPEDLFLDLNDHEKETLICNICFNVVNECFQCLNRHKFCRSCIFAWSLSYLSNANKCPVCRCIQDDYEPADDIDKLLASKLVQCQTDSCNEKTTLELFLIHNHGRFLYSNAHVDFDKVKQAHISDKENEMTLRNMILSQINNVLMLQASMGFPNAGQTSERTYRELAEMMDNMHQFDSADTITTNTTPPLGTTTSPGVDRFFEFFDNHPLILSAPTTSMSSLLDNITNSNLATTTSSDDNNSYIYLNGDQNSRVPSLPLQRTNPLDWVVNELASFGTNFPSLNIGSSREPWQDSRNNTPITISPISTPSLLSFSSFSNHSLSLSNSSTLLPASDSRFGYLESDTTLVGLSDNSLSNDISATIMTTSANNNAIDFNNNDVTIDNPIQLPRNIPYFYSRPLMRNVDDQRNINLISTATLMTPGITRSVINQLNSARVVVPSVGNGEDGGSGDDGGGEIQAGSGDIGILGMENHNSLDNFNLGMSVSIGNAILSSQISNLRHQTSFVLNDLRNILNTISERLTNIQPFVDEDEVPFDQSTHLTTTTAVDDDDNLDNVDNESSASSSIASLSSSSLSSSSSSLSTTRPSISSSNSSISSTLPLSKLSSKDEVINTCNHVVAEVGNVVDEFPDIIDSQNTGCDGLHMGICASGASSNQTIQIKVNLKNSKSETGFLKSDRKYVIPNDNTDQVGSEPLTFGTAGSPPTNKIIFSCPFSINDPSNINTVFHISSSINSLQPEKNSATTESLVANMLTKHENLPNVSYTGEEVSKKKSFDKKQLKVMMRYQRIDTCANSVENLECKSLHGDNFKRTDVTSLNLNHLHEEIDSMCEGNNAHEKDNSLDSNKPKSFKSCCFRSLIKEKKKKPTIFNQNLAPIGTQLKLVSTNIPLVNKNTHKKVGNRDEEIGSSDVPGPISSFQRRKDYAKNLLQFCKRK